MTKEPERVPPQSTVQAAGRVAEDVISGLKSQPTLLGLIVMNMLGILAAMWFLSELSTAQKERSTQLFDMLKTCLQSRTSIEPNLLGGGFVAVESVVRNHYLEHSRLDHDLKDPHN